MVLAVCLTWQAASAHAFLERSVPPVGSEVATPPSTLTLTFTEPIEPAFSSVAVTDGHGGRVDQGTLSTHDDGRALLVPLKPLAPGAYAVEWHVTSVDTHKTQGHFSFSVKP
jgi:copper resistance protein C